MTQSGQGNEPQPPAAPPAPPVRPASDASGSWGPGAHRAPLPPENPPGDSDATQYLPPLPAAPMPGAPLPPPPYAAPSGFDASTQYLPPVSGDGPLPGRDATGMREIREIHEIREIREIREISEVSDQPGPYGRGGPESAAEATQLLPSQSVPPLPGDAEATAFLPPLAAPGGPARTPDADATALIPPVTGGAGAPPAYLPPAAPARPGDAEATAFLPPLAGPGAAPGGPARTPDADATALMPPVAGGAGAPPSYLPSAAPAAPAAPARPADGGAAAFPPPATGGQAAGPATPFSVMAPAGDRPPPAEFDTLFRAAAPTQHLPPVPAVDPVGPPTGARRRAKPPQAGPVPPPPVASSGAHGFNGGTGQPPVAGGGAQGPRGRKKSPAVLIAAVVAGCAVAGLGAGALLSGGGDEKSDPQKAAVASPAPSAEPKGEATPSAAPSSAPPKSADPAEAQAKALDALLKDSNNSRDSVIKAVDSTRQCKDLGKSASDLTAAAGQRNSLVTRLGQTPTDKLPNSSELTAQLTKAWQSSASADSHYAAWARQVDSKKGCVKGHARPSSDSVAGDRASNEATAAKKKAAELWNPIAKKYGLTQHEWTQL
ncbi:hypothetical protein [Streptomyces sp. NPDC021096]|uniref:hypothetical protein n=1 Tax=Streptomyces sp. NPDC021096 TaxID=3154792 RepID=UPI00340B9179